jgi:hypothetical protein
VVQCGEGDGSCAVYWGADENGVPAALVLDFLVLDE